MSFRMPLELGRDMGILLATYSLNSNNELIKNEKQQFGRVPKTHWRKS